MSLLHEPGILIEALAQALRRAGMYNRNDQAAPAAVLWTDGERQWESLLPRLRGRLPILTLGPYTPTECSGPAYWLRCVLGGTLPNDRLLPGETPIVYLPGVSRQELRAIEECPKSLRPLAELQYRGVLWTQKNGRDWSIAAFLQSADGGLGIAVAGDDATRDALQRVLPRLADESLARLRREAPLRAAFLDSLLNPDEARSLLLWLNDPSGYRSRVGPAEWGSFCALCARTYEFDPERDGELHAARLLGKNEGPWEVVWQRYAESPSSYPALRELLRRARPQQLSLFERRASWPQDNETAESALRGHLRELESSLPDDARAVVRQLEAEHAERRSWVWAQLGQTPLAASLKHLGVLAKVTERPLGGPGLHEIGAAYAGWGWRADGSMLDALACVERQEDVQAVSAAIGALYRRWLEDAAKALQEAVLGGPPDAYLTAAIQEPPAGSCILFTDGLRYDLGQKLAAALEAEGCVCRLDWHFAALPSVTATAKPAVSPVAKRFIGGPELSVAVSGSRTALTPDVFRRQLQDGGHQVLRGEETGDPAGRAWTELGEIDAYGHEHGWKVAHHAAAEIRSLTRRIVALLDAGWQHVTVVTDHGWLLLPGGLPKADLPEHLTELRKGRCARLKPTSQTDQQTVPWHWNHDVRIALAPGICCYEAGKQYEHGGLSPQECVVPRLTVSRDAPIESRLVEITSITWRGLRCSVTLAGVGPGMLVDLRTKAADPGSSLTSEPKLVDPVRGVSLPVPDSEREGEAAFVVVLSQNGMILAQMWTTVGG
ncbi:MAG: BREX-1 system phosphatase PglZ type B [Dehalococcoidia bacterium]